MTSVNDIATLTQTAVQNSACLHREFGRLPVQDAEVEEQQRQEEGEETAPDELHQPAPVASAP